MFERRVFVGITAVRVVPDKPGDYLLSRAFAEDSLLHPRGPKFGWACGWREFVQKAGVWLRTACLSLAKPIEKAIEVVDIQPFVAEISRLLEHVEIGQIARLFVVVVTELGIKLRMNPEERERRVPVLIVGPCKRRNVEPDGFLSLVLREQLNKSAVDERRQFRGYRVSLSNIRHLISLEGRRRFAHGRSIANPGHLIRCTCNEEIISAEDYCRIFADDGAQSSAVVS